MSWTRPFDRANSLPVAFQASVFANDIGVALHAADRLDASAVMINDHTAFRTDWMPFAGRRESGYGVGGRPDLQHARDDAGEDARVPLSRVAGRANPALSGCNVSGQ